MIDNFVILVTCGAVVVAALRAAILERRARRAPQAESAPSSPTPGWRARR